MGSWCSSFRTAFQEEAWKRYNKRLQEEYEEEMERVVSFLVQYRSMAYPGPRVQWGQIIQIEIRGFKYINIEEIGEK